MRWLPWPCAHHYQLAPPQLPIWKSDEISSPVPIPNASLQHLQQRFCTLIAELSSWNCVFQTCLLLQSHEKSPRWKHRATRWRRPISRLIKPTERRMIPVKASSACDKSWRFWVSQVEDEMSKNIWETPSVLKKWHLLEDIDIESWNWIDIHLESEISFWNSMGTSTYLQILKLGGSRSIP